MWSKTFQWACTHEPADFLLLYLKRCCRKQNLVYPVNFNSTASVQMTQFLRICFFQSSCYLSDHSMGQDIESFTQIQFPTFRATHLSDRRKRETKNSMNSPFSAHRRFLSMEPFLELLPAVQCRLHSSVVEICTCPFIHFGPLFANAFFCLASY